MLHQDSVRIYLQVWLTSLGTDQVLKNLKAINEASHHDPLLVKVAWVGGNWGQFESPALDSLL